MEKHSESFPTPEFRSPEVVSIDQARFLDQLEPEYEKWWDELTYIMQNNRLHTPENIAKLWLDESLPQVIRDRIMLGIVGPQEAVRRLGNTTIHNAGYAFMGISVISYIRQKIEYFSDNPEQTKRKFTKWMDDSLDYQISSGNKVIDSTKYWNWLRSRYVKQEVDEAVLDKFLSAIDLIEVNPLSDGEGYPLSPFRFPVLDDLIFGAETSIQMKYWAKARLDLWLSKQKGSVVTLPAWLDSVSAARGKDIYANFFNRGRLEDAWQGIQIFGWTNMLKVRSIQILMEQAEKIEHNDVQNSLLEFLLTSGQELRCQKNADEELLPILFYVKNIDRLQAAVDRISKPELTELFNQAKDNMADYQQKLVKKHTDMKIKDEKERKLKQSAEETAHKNATINYNNILTSMRKIAPS